jgi:hypothetical protein
MNKKNILFTGWILFVLLLIEMVFRMLGNKPGDISPGWSNFSKVDTLKVKNDFYCSNGIVISSKENDTAYHSHINAEGFRNKEFNQVDSSRPVILLIGDSYTFGLSAKPISASFADILKTDTSAEYINLGIPAADPVQYEFLARKYIPVFKPSLVIIPFFLGNDIMLQDRKIDTVNPFWVNTNAGGFFLDIDNRHFKTPEQAYNYIINEKYNLAGSGNILEKIIGRSAVLSKLYSVKSRLEERDKFDAAVKTMDITKSHLYIIAALCKQQNAILKIIVIPELREAHLTVAELRAKYQALFNDPLLKESVSVPQVAESWYVPYPDGHLNNTGHQYYASYILSTFNQ